MRFFLIALFLIVISFITFNTFNKINSQDLRTEIIYNLDRCSQNFSLSVCRLAYNKPITVLNSIITNIFSQFSEENLFSFINSPLRQFLTLVTYIGIFRILLYVFK